MASLVTDQKEAAVWLAEISPTDPQTHFSSAVLHEKTFEPGDIQIALEEFENAASLSPYNYLIWIELGSARARAGDEVAAEAAFRRARDLAPSYARVHWALGNLLLRLGRDDEAYPELRKAVEGDPAFAGPAAAVALQMADGDSRIVQARFENLPHANLALISLLAGQKKYDEAAAVWSSATFPTADEKVSAALKGLARAFFDGKRFALAVGVAARQNTDGDIPVVERVTNSGFESPVKTDSAGAFDWRVAPTNYPQIGVTDTQKRSGRYGLITLFNNPDPKNFKGFSQTVAVRPGRTYELSVPYRADIKSKAPFHWEIVSAADSKRLAISDPLMISTDWAVLNTSFTVPADTDGVEIRFVRGDCIAGACAASGSFWFDDISITPK
jgi:Flp pilus assembly protein TadD